LSFILTVRAWLPVVQNPGQGLYLADSSTKKGNSRKAEGFCQISFGLGIEMRKICSIYATESQADQVLVFYICILNDIVN
jgi:hypothetical protein